MSGYIGPIPVPQGIQNKETFTATAGQTTFNTNGYTDGAFISVYLNGVRLINGTDYTATNGSDVVLASAANTGDVLDFESFNSFSLASQQFENITTKNPTHEDTDGGRESALSFQGEQSGGEISTLAAIQASHDGTADDQKGDLIFKTNDGSDNNAPTERMRIDSAGQVTITTPDNGTQLTLESTDADAAVGPVLDLFRNSASPTNFDLLGKVIFSGEDNGGNKTEYAHLQAYPQTVTGGAESGYFEIHSLVGGTDRVRMEANATEVVINNPGIDSDFRVESDGDANAFFVQGSDGHVGIGTSSPNIANFGKALTITDSAGSNQIPAIELAYGSNTRGANIAVDNRASSKVLSITAVASDLSMSFGTNNTERMRIDSSGILLVGTTSTATQTDGFRVFPTGSSGGTLVECFNDDDGTALLVGRGGSNGEAVRFYRGSTEVGSIDVTTTSTSYGTSSDYRLKENVTDVTDGITRVKQLSPKRFNFIADADTTVDGFLAHEAATVVPEAVTGTKDAMKDEEYTVTAAKGDVYTPATDDADEVVHSSNVEQPETLEEGQQWRKTAEAVMGTRSVPDMQGIDQSKLVPLLTAALQEAIAKIETLESENTAIKARLDALEAE